MQAATKMQKEKPSRRSIKLFGLELEGYTLRKLVTHIVLGVATAVGVIREEMIHSRHTEQIAELAKQEQKCEDRLDDALRRLEGKGLPPTNRAFVPVGDSHNEEWRKILLFQPPMSPLSIGQNSRFYPPESGKPSGQSR